ncbi:hypothetical protein FRX31_033441 [Thalictrum thalictroides]|uniref:Uncharacterized protein n=1 Tax=Thalictrum thalictroides TaxID=46969 RepID=A0A7J6UWH7_THATH|nr:hypothetical protein FRX31_033441 [Thalictrum thalictroides]
MSLCLLLGGNAASVTTQTISVQFKGITLSFGGEETGAVLVTKIHAVELCQQTNSSTVDRNK